MTDADVDGSHIRTLLLTFFPLYAGIGRARTFIYAQPPLYRTTYKGVHRYAYSDAEQAAILKELGSGSEKLPFSAIKGWEK